ncbi:MAG: heavy-metal-associated domain-containing protein [Paludibacteraceae bacterium]|nr:heavy-metal-associated domain-containing protein [Paludibacteraceae bacterium]
MEKRVFKVEGMMCNHCRANVEKALQNLQGAQNVTVDLASGTATLEGSVTDEAVIAAINSIGYTAHIA